MLTHALFKVLLFICDEGVIHSMGDSQNISFMDGLSIYMPFTSTSLMVSNFALTAVAQWLRCCATNRKVAGSIPAGVSGFFIDIKIFRSHCGPGVDSASNRNEYREYFLGVKAASA